MRRLAVLTSTLAAVGLLIGAPVASAQSVEEPAGGTSSADTISEWITCLTTETFAPCDVPVFLSSLGDILRPSAGSTA